MKEAILFNEEFDLAHLRKKPLCKILNKKEVDPFELDLIMNSLYEGC